MTASRNVKAQEMEKFFEAIISSAIMFRTRGAYGTYEKALNALTKRKPILETGSSRGVCEKQFKNALKVVDDALEFENKYIRKRKTWFRPSNWFDAQTIERIGKNMEQYSKSRNPEAPSIFISRCIARIYYFYHLA